LLRQAVLRLLLQVAQLRLAARLRAVDRLLAVPPRVVHLHRPLLLLLGRVLARVQVPFLLRPATKPATWRVHSNVDWPADNPKVGSLVPEPSGTRLALRNDSLHRPSLKHTFLGTLKSSK
jgi:hypothetical protein